MLRVRLLTALVLAVAMLVTACSRGANETPSNGVPGPTGATRDGHR